MNPRERILAISVGVLLVLGVLWYGWSWKESSLAARRARLSRLQGEVQKNEITLARARKATEEMNKFEQQSLPGDVERAQSLYQKWLLELVQRHGIQEGNVSAVTGRAVKGVYQQLAFSIKGRTDLVQATQLLHEFYSSDRLHRIRRLRMNPINEGKEIDLDIMIEVLALDSAPRNVTELKHGVSDRLTHGDAADYVKAIASRNMFQPPHQPPKITTTARSSYPLGSSVGFSIKGDDPERTSVKYAIEKASMEGARIDPRTGEFSWRPLEKGSYEIEVSATDSGLPAKTSKQTIKFAVVDPPKPPPVVRNETPPPPPPFDTAKFAYLTAVLGVDDKSEAWVMLRTTGQTLKLHPGDKFDVGTMRGTVIEIGVQDMVIETSDGYRLQLYLGENFRQAMPIGEPSPVSAAPQGDKDAAVNGTKPAPEATPTVKADPVSEAADAKKDPVEETEPVAEAKPEPFPDAEPDEDLSAEPEL
jgi:hypothetical protein